MDRLGPVVGAKDGSIIGGVAEELRRVPSTPYQVMGVVVSVARDQVRAGDGVAAEGGVLGPIP